MVFVVQRSIPPDTRNQPAHRRLLRSADRRREARPSFDVRAGDQILDVAYGSGSGALVAARRNADVTGIDYGRLPRG